MSGWTHAAGPAVALPLENIDTDQLIPARFMSAPRKEGYGRFLLHDLRWRQDGQAQDIPTLDGAEILVSGRNFGCGSSREAAVYALVDHGIRAVLAPSFGDIFAGNAVNNGLLPAQIEDALAERLMTRCPARIAIDIDARSLSFEGETHPFTLEATWAEKLINGWDDIDLTAQHNDTIAAAADARRREQPWVWPAAPEQDLRTTGRGARG
ncbi:MAG: 3-isopropylmalate dehydratase small subunit [Pseudomonadota bacterium]